MPKTSINIQPMKNGSEIHNTRRKDLDYVRAELSHLNESWTDPRYQDKSISEIRKDIENRYKQTVGQKMQEKAKPLREGVVVIDENTTMEQLQTLARKMEEAFGIKTIQIHIHRDEGFQNAKEWKPNLHAHMLFDWTQDNGKSLNLKRNSMSELQTLVAETLGMERGVSSDRKHLSAIQYKIQAEEARLQKLEEDNKALRNESNILKAENEELKQKYDDLLEKQMALIDEIKNLGISKRGKEALLERANKITNIFGKSAVQLKYEDAVATIEQQDQQIAELHQKVEKIRADKERRDQENSRLKKENSSLESEKLSLQSELADSRSETAKARQEAKEARKERNQLAAKLNPEWYCLPDVVDVENSRFVHTPRGWTLQTSIRGCKRCSPEPISDAEYQDYVNGKVTKEQMIARKFTKQISGACAKQLYELDQHGTHREFTLCVERIFKTIFCFVPGIMRSAISEGNQAQCCGSVNEKPNDYIRKPSYDELLLEIGYKVTQRSIKR